MKKLTKILVSLFLYVILTLTNINYVNIQSEVEIKTNPNILALNETRSKQTKKHIAIFIEFSNSDDNVVHHLDDELSVKNAQMIYNSDELFDMITVNGTKEEVVSVPSFKKYYERESYGDLSITTEIFPRNTDGNVISYTDIHPIEYYLKYSDTNKEGYIGNDEARQRESELINNAVNYVSSQISSSGITASEIDSNSDGVIDAISFIVEGQKNASVGWGDLLWSHKQSNIGVTNKILGKTVDAYNLLYATDYTESMGLFSLNRGGYGTIIHEFGHTLGYYDLYRYEDSVFEKPVGFYDIMGTSSTANPAPFLTYFTSGYNYDTFWHNSLPVITDTTNNITLTKPGYVDKNEKRAVKIEVGNNEKEFFIVEYHDKQISYLDSSADSSGIIIYRVNENNKYKGNANPGNYGEGDLIYVFRPNETGLGDARGDLSQATLNLSRKTYGKSIDLDNTDFDKDTIYFSNGTNSGITIEVTGETSNSVTFNVNYTKMNGTGSIDDPYLIGDVKTYKYLMSLDTKNKYYKLTNDIDFNGVTDYPHIDFEGNLDGNNKTLKNITTDGQGVFNFVGSHYNNRTTIKNLKIENITINSSGQDHVGGFAGVANDVELKNIHILNGSINYNGTPLNSALSVGGFVGTASNNVTIIDCSTNANITSTKNAGGFIGLNQNAVMKNSFASGSVTSSKLTGGFIGVQYITDSNYNVPENVYYNASKNQSLKLVGGCDTGRELSDVCENSLYIGIGRITIPENINVFVGSKTNLPITISPNANLNYNVSIENSNIAKYENNKIVALRDGTTKIQTEITIGTGTMRIESNLNVENINRPLTEEEVLNFVGLTKKNDYVIGFELGTKTDDLKKNIESLNGVTLKDIIENNSLVTSNKVIGTGMKFTINTNNTDYTYTVVIKGDVNGDGLIYATDYVKVKNHIMGRSTLTGAYLMAADINNDEKVYATDYVQIKNHIMGKSTIVQR